MFARQLLQATRLLNNPRQQCRTIWNSKKEFDQNLLVKIQQDYDVSASGLMKWLEKRRWRYIKEDHMYNREQHEFLGSDLMAAHFIVARGGMVKAVGSDNWVKKEKGQKKLDLPQEYDPNWKLEAVEKCDMIFIHDSFCNLVNLDHLKYLGFREGKYIDDWCLDALVEYRNTLNVLDISGCKKITERGLPTLHRLKKLKRLRMYDMAGLSNPGMTLIMLEEMLPHVVIETDIQYHDNSENISRTSYIKNLDQENIDALPGLVKDLDLDMRTHSFKS